jgi:ubiquinone biosynthesis protein COQ9
LTRIFFLGNKDKKSVPLKGTALPLTLAIIFALSIAMSAWHSAAIVQYAGAKKALAAYYAKLNAHNADISDEAD